MKIIILALLLVLVSCEEKRKPEERKPEELTWRYVKSPLSGRCYEIAQSGSMITGTSNSIKLFAMNEVPCWEMERKNKK